MAVTGRRAHALALAAACAGIAGCGHDFEPPDRRVRVEHADAAYTTALFDSITWSGPDERSQVGNTVYAERCRRCHGPLGRGGTEYDRVRGLEVPSLVEPDWDLDEVDDLRHKLFIGHESGMPVFGEGLLSPREIDATAAYILLTLRPELQGQG